MSLPAARQGLTRDALGTAAITFFVVSAAGPMIVVAGGAPVGMLFGDGAGMPAAYLVATVVLLVFSVGYTAMAREVQDAGGFYAFAEAGLGPIAGGAAAMTATVSYNVMQIGIYGMFASAAGALIKAASGLSVPWPALALAAMAAVGWCGYRRIDVSARVLGVLVAAEYASVLALDVFILRSGGASGINLAPFSPGLFLQGSPEIGLLFCFASFIGFEATTIYAEEARNPRWTVPIATFLSVVLIGAFYGFTTWCMVLGVGSDRLAAVLKAAADPTQLLFQLSGHYAPGLTFLLRALFVTSVFAGLLAFHNAAARYHFALGRSGLLPRVLARTHPDHGSPHVGSLVQSALALVGVCAFAAAGADPVLALFNWLTNVATLGVLVLMAMASISAVAFFARRREKPAVWTWLFAPLGSALALAGVVVLAVAHFGLLTGASRSIGVLLPAGLGLVALLGAGLGACRRAGWLARRA
jgi:amino acid transporter